MRAMLQLHPKMIDLIAEMRAELFRGEETRKTERGANCITRLIFHHNVAKQILKLSRTSSLADLLFWRESPKYRRMTCVGMRFVLRWEKWWKDFEGRGSLKICFSLRKELGKKQSDCVTIYQSDCKYNKKLLRNLKNGILGQDHGNSSVYWWCFVISFNFWHRFSWK